MEHHLKGKVYSVIVRSLNFHYNITTEETIIYEIIDVEKIGGEVAIIYVWWDINGIIQTNYRARADGARAIYYKDFIKLESTELDADEWLIIKIQ